MLLRNPLLLVPVGGALLAVVVVVVVILATGGIGGSEATPTPTLTSTPTPTATATATATPTMTPTSTPIPTAMPTATASPQARPTFDPDALACVNTPPVIIERSWQVSAPRGIPGPVRPGEIVEIGLRNKFGEPGEGYYVSARVIDPEGASTTATASLQEAEWSYLLYPADFPGATPVYPGVYTVIWETEGGFIACDGFVVESY